MSEITKFRIAKEGISSENLLLPNMMVGVNSPDKPNFPDCIVALSIVRHTESSFKKKEISMGNPTPRTKFFIT